MNQSFEELELVDGNLRVVFEHIGEGYGGDYNPDDDEDQPLLRFSCYERNEKGEWRDVDDASYCTRLSIHTPRQVLERALAVIMRELKDAREAGASGKRAMEAMSWLCIEDFSRAA